MRPHPASSTLVLPEQVCVRWGRHDVMHDRGRRVGQDRAVQVREQRRVTAKGGRQDCQVIHVAGNLGCEGSGGIERHTRVARRPRVCLGLGTSTPHTQQRTGDSDFRAHRPNLGSPSPRFRDACEGRGERFSTARRSRMNSYRSSPYPFRGHSLEHPRRTEHRHPRDAHGSGCYPALDATGAHRHDRRRHADHAQLGGVERQRACVGVPVGALRAAACTDFTPDRDSGRNAFADTGLSPSTVSRCRIRAADFAGTRNQ